MSHRGLTGVFLLACITASAQQPPTPRASTQTIASGDSTAEPLPDIHALIARVHARAIALENLRKKYICTMTQTADEFSSDGSKKTHTDEYQAFYVGTNEIFQHLSRDGKPLSPQDAKKEQERVDKLVAKLKSHNDEPDKNQVVLNTTGLLKMATFTNPRREIIDGRSTIAFNFRGNPNAKADNLGEEIIRRLTGTLWVDEHDDAITRFYGELDENFHVGGGLLVNIKKGSWFNFTFERVNGEIWFPAHTTGHIDGRFLLFKGINGNLSDTFTDYRKLKTSVTILPGTQVLDEDNAPPPTAPDSTPPAAPRHESNSSPEKMHRDSQ